MKFACSWMTAQPQQGGVGSGDWLKEVYLAPDPVSLYQLMRKFKPSGVTPPLTTAASRQTMVYYMDKTRTPHAKLWTSVIGLGTDHTVTGADGKPEKLRVFDTLEVTEGDANESNNGLYNHFRSAIPALEVSKE